ncbi:hypothetical protein [Bacillus multifaciens]|uniref:hypothetical protein n=1 Tax=Bacillus multifaciens TaxID=3068506 RepID=UPI002740FA64|nr:hypothetical protein [Bacillus sp. WLY-B-L8]MDP7981425.1 hypothetical protein [Bacillus sp. WLY-B-L8]
METKKQNVKSAVNQGDEKHCGIIMPIAPMDGYTADHWSEVKSIITEATKQVDGIKFKTEIVSNSDGEIDIIHKRIIQNLYNADIVICDISGRNPNVMFELGMRLTFDKPTIIIKDDVTDFIFDTGVIEHLIYPKDLRFKKIVEFQKLLASRIKITYEKSQNDTTYSTFLGNFGEFKVPTLNQETISDVNQIILDELSNIRTDMNNVKREIAASKEPLKQRTFNHWQQLSLSEMLSVQSYIKENKDMREPIDIVNDQDFQRYLSKHTIELNNENIKQILNIIRQAQENNM